MSNRALKWLDISMINFIDSQLGFIHRNQLLFLHQVQHHELCPLLSARKAFYLHSGPSSGLWWNKFPSSYCLTCRGFHMIQVFILQPRDHFGFLIQIWSRFRTSLIPAWFYQLIMKATNGMKIVLNKNWKLIPCQHNTSNRALKTTDRF